MKRLETKFTDSLKLFFPDYDIIFGEKIEINKTNKKLILPISFSNVPEEVVLGLVIFLLEKNNLELEDVNHSYLDELERKQLSKLYSYLKLYKNLDSGFIVDKRGKLKKFLEFFASKISVKGPLWEFIKSKFLDIDNFNLSINQLVEEYLEFKGAYLQSHCEECKTNFDELIEEDDSYNEHDGVQLEPMNGPDLGVIGYLEPALRKTYFARAILEKFNFSNQKFVKVVTDRQKILPQTYEQILSVYFVKGRKGATYVLPLSKDLAVVSYDSSAVEVYQDKYGIYYIKFLKDGEFGLNIGNRKEKIDFSSGEANELIYTGSKIDLSKFSSWKDLKKFIKGKKYANVSQKGFHKSDVNGYIEALYEASQMDCLPANILFVVLSRSLGYPARLVIGYQTYIKDKKTYVSTNQGHAWAEIFDNGKWIRVDATPVNTDQQENQEKDLDNMIEQVVEDFQEKDLQLKNGNTQAKLKELFEECEGIENPLFKSALEYVREDAMKIVDYIKRLLDERRQFLLKQKLRGQPKKRKRRQTTGVLNITADMIERLTVGDPSIFEKNKKMKLKPNEDIDTKLKDITVAIDVSGSMEGLTGNWQNGTKLDNAYLSLTLLYIVAKKLDISFDKVFLFSDEVIKGSPKEILNSLDKYVGGGNEANTRGIKEAVKSIANTQKGVVFVISDGDGATGTRFFDEESKKILAYNKNLFIVGYGIGEDATQKLQNEIKGGKIPTVIEYRMWEAGLPEQSKGFNVKEYGNLVDQFRKHLEQFMTVSKIKL